jgi:RNA polymerase sigma-70 factor (ECF subfamily)
MNISETLKKLYISLKPILLRYASRYVPESIAEDIVQDSFLRYYDRYLWTTEKEEASQILFSITHNLCIDYLRHLSIIRDYKSKMYVEIALDELEHFHDDDMAQLANMKINKIRILIELLPPRQREILHLYYAENMKSTEIASRLELSRRTVENTIYRALISIRKQI